MKRKLIALLAMPLFLLLPVFAGFEVPAIEIPPSAGKTYKAMVPDTLDLAERARLAINGLTRTLDEEHDYEQYFLVRYTADPPYMMHLCLGDLAGCTAKWMESLPMMRLMSGSDQNLDIEGKLASATVGLIGEDGLFYVPAIDSQKTPWRVRVDYPKAEEPVTGVFGDARVMLAMLALYQRDHDPLWRERLQKMSDGLCGIAIDKGDYAFYPEGKVGMEFAYLKKSGWKYDKEPGGEHEGAEGSVILYHGGQIRALTRWYQFSGDKRALAMAGKLTRFITQRKMWGADADTRQTFGPDHGHFHGHFHGNLVGLRGMLEYAQAANDFRLKEFIRESYAHARNWGLGRIGCFGDGCWKAHTEGCSVADATALAIKLCDYGVGDYWDDVDGYARNHLVEMQLTNADLLKKVGVGAAQNPDCWKSVISQPVPWDPKMWSDIQKKNNTPNPLTDKVIERTLGLFAGFGDPTAATYTLSCGCCSGNCTQALYYVWEAATRFQDGVATVNLLLNRAAPWLDIDSYLPYEGKVVIHNKTARKLLVRIPGWANKKAVRCAINGKKAVGLWVGNYLILEKIAPKDTVTIEFPMVEETVKLNMPFDRDYTLHFKGNTLIDISPRETNPAAYPFYQRDEYKKNKAPMKEVTRFVSPVTIAW